MSHPLDAILAEDQPWQTAYPLVAKIAAAYLDSHNVESMSTLGLVEALWPQIEVLGVAHAKARDRLTQALRAISKHDLKEYTSPGAQKFGRRTGKPYNLIVWHKRKPAPTCCPMCGQSLPAQASTTPRQ